MLLLPGCQPVSTIRQWVLLTARAVISPEGQPITSPDSVQPAIQLQPGLVRRSIIKWLAQWIVRAATLTAGLPIISAGNVQPAIQPQPGLARPSITRLPAPPTARAAISAAGQPITSAVSVQPATILHRGRGQPLITRRLELPIARAAISTAGLRTTSAGSAPIATVPAVGSQPTSTIPSRLTIMARMACAPPAIHLARAALPASIATTKPNLPKTITKKEFRILSCAAWNVIGTDASMIDPKATAYVNSNHLQPRCTETQPFGLQCHRFRSDSLRTVRHMFL